MVKETVHFKTKAGKVVIFHRDKVRLDRRLRMKIKEAKALARAKLEGERQFHGTQKGSMHWLKLQIAEFLKKDPVKLTVFVGTTWLVYKTLLPMDDIAKRMGKVKFTPTYSPFALAEIAAEEVWKRYAPRKDKETEDESGVAFDVDLLLLSMLVAYLIMEHGIELLGSIVGGAKMLLGMI